MNSTICIAFAGIPWISLWIIFVSHSPVWDAGPHCMHSTCSPILFICAFSHWLLASTIEQWQFCCARHDKIITFIFHAISLFPKRHIFSPAPFRWAFRLFHFSSFSLPRLLCWFHYNSPGLHWMTGWFVIYKLSFWPKWQVVPSQLRLLIPWNDKSLLTDLKRWHPWQVFIKTTNSIPLIHVINQTGKLSS